MICQNHQPYWKITCPPSLRENGENLFRLTLGIAFLYMSVTLIFEALKFVDCVIFEDLEIRRPHYFSALKNYVDWQFFNPG